jgi:membrane fusion protein (multidrug efflux system)
MKKRILISFVIVVMVTGVLGGIKALQIRKMIAYGEQFVPPPATVTATPAETDAWIRELSSVGSLEAVQGVTVTAELPGKVVKIAFTPGSRIEAGELIVQQDISSETAQLRSANTNVKLTLLNYDRAKELIPENVIPQSQLDAARAAYEQALAERDNIRATIAKKTIRAPFSGRLGIRLVNLGQNLKDGQAIVSLQSMDPIFVNFLLPQQNLSNIQLGMTVRVTTDVLPGTTIEGRITAMNSEVDTATRNIRIQATVDNPDARLRPGMYVDVAAVLPTKLEVVSIPATAVLYAPYSDSVFVVEEKPASEGQPPGQVLRQQLVSLGEQRGDFVAVSTGLKQGDMVVSTGVFKLRNGQAIVVDNSLAPEFKLGPRPENS